MRNALILCLGLFGCSTIHPAVPATAWRPDLVIDRGILPAGARLAARSDREISTRYAKVGDPFIGTVTTPIADEHGAWPVGCVKVEGTVKEVVRGLADRTPALYFSIERVNVGGQWEPLKGRIASVQFNDRQHGDPEQAARTAGIWGVIVGAMAGRYSVFGTVEAYEGRNLAATAGYLNARVKDEHELYVPPGGVFTIELERPLTVPKPACPLPSYPVPPII